jgi:hypothetical protein
MTAGDADAPAQGTRDVTFVPQARPYVRSYAPDSAASTGVAFVPKIRPYARACFAGLAPISEADIEYGFGAPPENLYEYNRYQVEELARTVTYYLERTCALSKEFGREFNVGYECTLTSSLWLVLELSRALTSTGLHDRFREVVDLVNRARAVDYDHRAGSNLKDDLAHADDIARLERRVESDLACARDLARDVQKWLRHRLDTKPAAPLTPSTTTHVAKTSRQLTKWAVRVLPAENRAEYAEHFSADLVHLAHERTSWLAQVRHSARVLVRAPWLRRELRAPAPGLKKRPR